MAEKRILIVTDTHYCHFDWYGVSADERMERLIRDINAEYERDPFEMILFLGDYSLDHWKWQIQGSWLKEGKSYTDLFVKNYLDGALPTPYYMIAGNHEQYGHEKWKEITGCERQFYVTMDDYLFLMLDSYGANLDPTEHSDGTYSPMDVEWVKSVMEANPDKKVIVLTHYFDESKESDEAKAIIADERVICVFAGHTHRANIVTLSEACGSKKMIFAGNYSYCGSGSDPDPGEYLWGFRDLYLGEHVAVSKYIIPANDVVIKGVEKSVEYHCIEDIKIEY
ncbi:MAG: metallophosphoesterase [Clostridia bacterium]|nr:metallophosphoesterase [Clostridia bacterium]